MIIRSDRYNPLNFSKIQIMLENCDPESGITCAAEEEKDSSGYIKSGLNRLNHYSLSNSNEQHHLAYSEILCFLWR